MGSGSNIPWTREHTNVAKLGDELWLEVKRQSNLDIAGSPRNNFRVSVRVESVGGRALNGLGGYLLTEPYQTPNAIRYTGQLDCEG